MINRLSIKQNSRENTRKITATWISNRHRPTSTTTSTIFKRKRHYSTPIAVFAELLRPLVNCQVELELLWTKDYLLIEHHNNIKGVSIMITTTKSYVSVAPYSINHNIKFIENLKQ